MQRATLALVAIGTAVACGREASVLDSPSAPPSTAETLPPSPTCDQVARPPATAASCRVPMQLCGCETREPAPCGAGGGIGLCQQLDMECASMRLRARFTSEHFSDFNRCAGSDFRRITFDDLPVGTPLPADYLESRGVKLTTRADCAPVIDATTDGAPGERSLVTCAATLGDVTIFFGTGDAVGGLVFDRPADAAGARPQFLLRVYGGGDPYRNDFLANATVVRDVGEYAMATTFPSNESRSLLGFTSVFPDEAIFRMQVGVEGDCPASGPPEPSPVRVAEIVICGKR